MQTHKFEKVTLHVSDDMIGEIDSGEKDSFRSLVEDHYLPNFVDVPGYREFVDAFFQKSGLDGYSILSAHGYEDDSGRFVYRDGRKDRPVQSWIDENDGLAGVLLLCVCNPAGSEITSNKSVVLVPDHVYSARRSRSQVEMFVPGTGYVNQYVLDAELARLRGESEDEKIAIPRPRYRRLSLRDLYGFDAE